MPVKFELTVFFEDPFWVGHYERQDGKSYEAARIVFGSEPKDYEVYSFLMQNFKKLRFSPKQQISFRAEKRINPKRAKRIINKQLISPKAGTKAQNAFKLQREETLKLKKQVSSKIKTEEKQAKFELRRKKQKEKHRGH